jgi:tetratricopeptide (TPR) repeat protein
MIPCLLSIALVVGCKNVDSPKESVLTIEQRRATITAAMDYLDAGKFTESLAIMKALVNKDPSGAETQESYGLVLLACASEAEDRGDSKRALTNRTLALEAYKLACNTASKPGLLQLSTAQLAHMIGKKTIANQYYELAHNTNLNDARASFFLSQLYMLDRQWVEAKTWIDLSLTRNAHEPFALMSSALIEAELGNTQLALDRATRGCFINPDNPNLRVMQARVLRLTGSAEQALNILRALPPTTQESSITQDEIAQCRIAIQEQMGAP